MILGVSDMSEERKFGIFLMFAVIVLVIILIGGYSNYKKCDAEGGEFIRGWLFGPRCLIIEREIDL